MRSRLHLVLFLLLCLLMAPSSHGLQATIGEWTTETVTQGTMLTLSYNITNHTSLPFRVSTHALQANLSHPVFVSVRQGRHITSWNIPYVQDSHGFLRVERTLCPILNTAYSTNATSVSQSYIYVDVSLPTDHPQNVSVLLDYAQDYKLSLNSSVEVTLSAPSPVFYVYEFPDSSDTDDDEVLVSLTSDSNVCALVSVQDGLCPNDLLVEYPSHRGVYQTMERLSAITYKRPTHQNFFYVVVTILHDEWCAEATRDLIDGLVRLNTSVQYNPVSIHTGELYTDPKNISISIKTTLPTSKFWIGPFVSFLVYFIFYLVVLGWILIDWRCFHKQGPYKVFEEMTKEESKTRVEYTDQGLDEPDNVPPPNMSATFSTLHHGGGRGNRRVGGIMRRPNFISVLKGSNWITEAERRTHTVSPKDQDYVNRQFTNALVKVYTCPTPSPPPTQTHTKRSAPNPVSSDHQPLLQGNNSPDHATPTNNKQFSFHQNTSPSTQYWSAKSKVITKASDTVVAYPKPPLRPPRMRHGISECHDRETNSTNVNLSQARSYDTGLNNIKEQESGCVVVPNSHPYTHTPVPAGASLSDSSISTDNILRYSSDTISNAPTISPLKISPLHSVETTPKTRSSTLETPHAINPIPDFHSHPLPITKTHSNSPEIHSHSTLETRPEPNFITQETYSSTPKTHFHAPETHSSTFETHSHTPETYSYASETHAPEIQPHTPETRSHAPKTRFPTSETRSHASESYLPKTRSLPPQIRLLPAEDGHSTEENTFAFPYDTASSNESTIESPVSPLDPSSLKYLPRQRRFIPPEQLTKHFRIDKYRMSHLSIPEGKAFQKRYEGYWAYIIAMVLFYAIPTYQLLLTYQKYLNHSGNEDFCYYNTLCSHRLGLFSAFNSIWSNIGFFMLGLLFLVIARRKREKYRYYEKVNENLESTSNSEHKVGIPQHFGIYYAVGVAIMGEGLMSTAYHICPTGSNYQFDTTMMFVLVTLGLYKLYECRNPDKYSRPHKLLLVLALMILFIGMGVLYSQHVGFYVFFFVVFETFAIYTSLQNYYRWIKIWPLRQLGEVLLELMCNVICRPFPIQDKWKFAYMTFSIVFNIIWGVYLLFRRPIDFASMFLFVLISNLMCSLVYYVISKCKYELFRNQTLSKVARQFLLCKYEKREKQRLVKIIQPIFYLTIALVMWSVGIYMYSNGATDWLKSPSGSRNINQECLILDFFDIHDIWHFVSAIALFFSFLLLMTLDDSQEGTNRNKLRIF